jgi:mannose/cellobiose epimerase-like protein (N-acyl-D-glucosamine 2-epimerase family)
MFSSGLQLTGSNIFHGIFCLWIVFSTGVIALGQESPEKKLSKVDLQRPEVAGVAERLRTLRKSEARFGPKHPALPSVLKQIASLEEQLRELTAQGAAERPSNLPPSRPSVLQKGSDEKLVDPAPNRPLEKPILIPSEWGFEPWSRWPSTVKELSNKLKSRSAYQEAYPWLGLRDIIAVGPMPGMGLMWGIQYDPIVDRSYVFQWFDSPGSSQKTIYFESPGQILSIYFPTAFDQDGRFWILQETKQQDPQYRGADPSAWKTAQVVIFQADRYPPYQVDFKSADRPGGLELHAPESAQILASQQKGWFYRGEVQFVEQTKLASKVGFELKSLEDGLGAWGAPPTDGHSSRSFRSMGQDSVGEALIVDRIGRVTRWNRGDHATASTATWGPKKLSQLGWYSSIVDGAMVDGFRKYIPEPSIETSDIEKSSLLLALGERASDFAGFRTDYWFCLPQGTTIMLDERGNSNYPDGTIFVQTISHVSSADSSQSIPDRKIETRVLVFADHEWFAASYVWDAEQSDAELVESQEQIDLQIEGKDSMVPWRILKPTGCFECHRNGTITRNPSKLDLAAVPSARFGATSRDSAWNQSIVGTPARPQKIEWPPLLAAGIERSSDPTGGQGVDWDWFKKSLVEENLEPWYRASVRPSGFFCTELDETWVPKPNASATLVSQTRQIYTMAVGYSITKDPRLLEAMKRGITFLLERFTDTKHGGYFYQVNEQGQVLDRGKDGYGHAFVIYALATAAKVSGEAQYSDEALKCWEVLRSSMMESDGGLMWKASEDFSGLNRRSQNPNMHLFEGLLELYDATKDPGVYSDTQRLLDFVVVRLRHESGVIPENYQGDWDKPAMVEQKPYFEMGHQVEWAFLISRAVELGYPMRYLEVGQELMDYSMSHGYDQQSGGLHERPGAGKGGWQQAEFLRSLLRYYSMHGRSEYLEPIRKTQALIRDDFIDHRYGGWIERGKKEKGNHWKAASHEVAMYIEGIRIENLLRSQRVESLK